MTSFPSSVVSFTAKTDGVDYPQAAHINSIQDEVAAIETALKANFGGSPAQGAVMYFDGTKWTGLAAGTSGYFLKTQGAAANPIWAVTGAPRVTTITSSATPTINTDSCDSVTITALAAAITSMTTNLSGTPTNFQKLIIRIKDNGTARAITWGASFEAKGVPLPTTTVISKVLTVGFIYDSVSAKWGCVAAAQEV